MGRRDPFFEVLLDFSLDLVQVVENFIQTAVALQQLHSSFGADPFHPGNVVRRVTTEGLIIHHLPRPDAQFFFHLFGAKLADAIFAVEVQNPNSSIGIDQLEQILIAT